MIQKYDQTHTVNGNIESDTYGTKATESGLEKERVLVRSKDTDCFILLNIIRHIITAKDQPAVQKQGGKIYSPFIRTYVYINREGGDFDRNDEPGRYI